MKTIDKELQRIEKSQMKFHQKPMKSFPYKEKIVEKVPIKLQETLIFAFQKAFETAFLKGTVLLEKTYDKEELQMQHEANQLLVTRKTNRKHVRNMDKTAKKSALLHDALSTTSGTLMGFLGMGIPDIPVLVSIILRQVYQCALSYGFDYETEEEKIFILHLICEALNTKISETMSLSDEIKRTSACLAEKLLVEKFIQGIPIVGATGGIINHQLVRRISKYATLTYKKRWLLLQK